MMALPVTVVLRYGVLALPLAMALVPVYVQVPNFYGEQMGLPIAVVGFILFATRLLDAIQDPLIGALGDRSAKRGRWMLAGVALLCTGMLGLFHPPHEGETALGLWLAGSLLVTYLGLSLVSVNYLAWGATLSQNYTERTSISAARAAFGLVGVVAAALLPGYLAEGSGAGLARFSEWFVALLLVAAALSISSMGGSSVRNGARISLADLLKPYHDQRFRHLMLVAVTSGLAGAIPATLMLFFVQDVLGAETWQGAFLAIYFVAAVCAMPLWVVLAARRGKRAAWMTAMLTAVAAFVGAFFLGPADVTWFAAVCAISGMAYGAELAIPPSILADITATKERDGPAREGAFFGAWQMTEKLTLAVAAGLALPLLQWGGYEPGASQGRFSNLAILYGLVPCGLKLLSILILAGSPVDRRVPAINGGSA
jgi:Na+/melibiose symporter-like transporter